MTVASCLHDTRSACIRREGIQQIQDKENLSRCAVTTTKMDAQKQIQKTGLPHGVLMGGGQAWIGGRRAAGRSHDPVSQQEVPEEGGHKQVLHASAPCCLMRCPTQSGACMCHTASNRMDV